MPRLRRHLVPLLLMLPVVFVCGKLLLTPVNDGVADNNYSRGWPWVFLYVDVNNYREIPFIKDLSIWPLLGDLCVFALFLLTFSWLLLRRYHRPGGLVRFSLRTLLIVVAVAAAGCAWWMHHIRQSHFEESLQRRYDGGNVISLVDEIHAPHWLRCFISDEDLHIFNRIETVFCELPQHYTGLPEELLEAMPQLPYLDALYIRSDVYEATKDRSRLRFQRIDALQTIESLTFENYTADDTTLERLGELPRLQWLQLSVCPISDRGLASIASCKSIESLEIDYLDSVTASGIGQLQRLEQLSYLLLGHVEITDEIIDSLARLKSLQWLRLENVKMTDQVARRLIELPALQKLEIAYIGWSKDAARISGETWGVLSAHIDEAKQFYSWRIESRAASPPLIVPEK